MRNEAPFRLGRSVRDALYGNKPVVALETALVTHGLPEPLNLSTALEMEQEVRQAGAVPATVGVLNGEIIIGMSQEELHQLASSTDPLKVSSRGLPYAATTGSSAGLTVSATSWLAGMAGIEFFATGGIGGVHFGASETGDISSDLMELSRARVAIVSSGIKSILDIGRTLEYLETAGVPVYGYQTDEFPAFFSGFSGFPVPYRLDTIEQAAQVWQKQQSLGLPCSALIACPPPVSVENADASQAAIDQANQEAQGAGVTGGAITPFVLRRIAEITDGASIDANVALLRNNARIAGEIASAFKTL
jgi:pseudouridylate synthase